jgi:hypothetical protein
MREAICSLFAAKTGSAESSVTCPAPPQLVEHGIEFSLVGRQQPLQSHAEDARGRLRLIPSVRGAVAGGVDEHADTARHWGKLMQRRDAAVRA